MARENARKQLLPKFDVYNLDLANTPNGFCPVINEAEKRICLEKFSRIETQREIENLKDYERHLANDVDCEARAASCGIPEPLPNSNHTYC